MLFGYGQRLLLPAIASLPVQPLPALYGVPDPVPVPWLPEALPPVMLAPAGHLHGDCQEGRPIRQGDLLRKAQGEEAVRDHAGK